MKIENSKILVTGGSGFLGHHIVKALRKKKSDISLLIQPHEKIWRLEGIQSQLKVLKATLTDREDTKAIVKGARPEVIIHFAGLMERRRDLEILDNLYDAHVISTINLILAVDPKITKLIIITGTSEEYGEQADPLVETLPVDPVSPYSATKAAATAMAIYLSKAISVPVLIMRPFITYGPAQIHDTLIPFLIKGVLQKKKVELTAGLQYRDFLYVDDLVSCYLAGIEKAESFAGPEIFNVGSGQNTRVRTVVEMIAKLLEGHDYLDIGARPMRAGEVKSMIADIQKTRQHLSWQPSVNLQEGLKKTIDWWLRNEKFWRQ